MSEAAELAHLFRAMKAPAAARSLPKLAERARSEEWSYERFAAALLAYWAPKCDRLRSPNATPYRARCRRNSSL